MKFEKFVSPPAGLTSATVNSLTRKVEVVKRSGKLGGTFFTKQDKNGKEAGQLKFLGEQGLPVPKRGYWVSSTHTLGVIESGETLYAKTVSANKNTQQEYFAKAGELLAKIHRKFEGVDLGAASECPQETAHPIRNFKHRFMDLESSSVEALLDASEEDIPESLRGLVGYLMELIEIYYQRVGDVLNFEDDALIYGDFKPENILVSTDDSLTLIDPELVVGHPCFDVAKFFSRSVIDGFKPSAIKAFLRSYDEDFDLSEVLYADAFTTRDIAAIDLINIFSSYVGRSLLQNSEHRLVKRMRKDGRIEDVIKSLSRISTPTH